MAKEIKGWLRLNELVFRGKPKGFYPFDTVAIAYLLQPDLFKSNKLPVLSTNVEKRKYKKFDFSTITMINQKLLDQEDTLSNSDKVSWVEWTMEIDSKSFMKLVMERLY